MTIVSDKFRDFGKNGKDARLGIMGGTFDPIHIGHLVSAERARQAYNLCAVLFVPTNNSVFKKDQQVSDCKHRLEMCKLAVSDNPYFDVSDIDIKRGGDTYTVDTLNDLRKVYPHNISFYFITGIDAVCDIMSWHKSDEVAKLANFIAVTRPGYSIDKRRKEFLSKNANFNIEYLKTSGLAISSSELRKNVANNQSIRYLCPQSVVNYIYDNNLYK